MVPHTTHCSRYQFLFSNSVELKIFYQILVKIISRKPLINDGLLLRKSYFFQSSDRGKNFTYLREIIEKWK